MEQPLDEWDLVIKVKYGDTLRRIGAYVSGRGMDHNMSKLREKIINLFKFSHDADFILTYTDEDGDIVTVDGDDELHDAVIGQHLNPLRINVQLKSNTGNTGCSDARSETSTPAPSNPLRIKLKSNTGNTGSSNARSETSTPARANSPQLQTPLKIHSIIDEALRSVPETFSSALENLSNVVLKAVTSSPAFAQFDEALKSEAVRSALSNLSNEALIDASSSPAFAQFVECFSKLGLSNATQLSHGLIGTSGGCDGASTPLVDLNVSYEPKASNDPIQEGIALTSTSTISVQSVPKQHESGYMEQGMGATSPTTVDLNRDAPRNVTASLYPFDDLLASIWSTNECVVPEKECASACVEGTSVAVCHVEKVVPGSECVEAEKEGVSAREGKSVAARVVGIVVPPGSQSLDHNSQNFGNPMQSFCNSPNFGTPMRSVPNYSIVDMVNGISSDKQSIMNSQAPSTLQFGFDSHSDAPISSQVGAPPPGLPPLWSYPMMNPYRRSQSFHETLPRTFHRGVQCDGCGMHPIVGPRFKSNMKEDYDICNICFMQMGNEADYTRIDKAAHSSPRLLKEFHNHHSKYRFPPSNAFHGYCVKPPRTKLESQFIQDVTVLDGTVMAPSTHFTKIWRMCNNGNVSWPYGTQLVWVGGDQFGDLSSTDLEIPANGFPVDKELDIAVDFTAPSRPGRYVSYWRMSSPSGQKFGQRVWLLIQVDYSQPNSVSGSSFHPDLNLNQPLESIGQNGSGIIDVNAQPLDGGFPETNVTGTTEELVKPVVDDVPVRHVDHLTQGIDGLRDAINDELSKPTVAEVVRSASYSFMDLPAMPSSFDASPAAAAADNGNQVEQTLLKELQEMGFKQIDLNKEILRLNEYNLEQSVDDLCGFAEWDPLLTELQEMGFSDKELNKKLLIKNGGSIKRSVLDLIAGELE